MGGCGREAKKPKDWRLVSVKMLPLAAQRLVGGVTALTKRLTAIKKGAHLADTTLNSHSDDYVLRHCHNIFCQQMTTAFYEAERQEFKEAEVRGSGIRGRRHSGQFLFCAPTTRSAIQHALLPPSLCPPYSKYSRTSS